MKRIIKILLVIISVCNLYASGSKDSAQHDKPVFAVSILPQTYFVSQIAGDTVTVLVLVGEGQSPHSYEPTPLQIANLSRASVWVLSGTDFEVSFQKKVSSQFPSIKIVDGTKGIKLRELNEWEIEADEHHDEEEDDHAAADIQALRVDKHTWLGKENAKIMASHIYKSLVDLNPAQQDFYTENYTQLIRSIDETFTVLHTQLDNLHGRSILVFHPSFGYFFDEFGITQLSVETGGKEPSARVLADLIEKAKKEKIPAIFVQKQFSLNAAQKIAAATGAKVVALDPLSADWMNNLQSIGNALVEVYR